jgi:diaminohydroxyphosphoribosylaminopyrimidine deaminase/5-amino-6-(5-phosphoribosylamino)uracil reductase
MQRCLDLARRGVPFVSPNPMVGCVIVKNGKVVGEGYHRAYGKAHAEVHALRRAGRAARASTLYVNLEPCSHHGNTPPCVDAIIRAGVRRVVVAVADPNPLVSGKGLAKLRRAGITVTLGVLRRQAEALNEKFMTYMKERRPFVTVKIAQTLDGKIADARGRSKWISSTASRRFVHELRSQHDAVLVGANTVNIDNPRLTVRGVRGNNPIRVVVDGRLSVNPSRTVFYTTQAPTILLTSEKAVSKRPGLAQRFERRGVVVYAMKGNEVFSARRILHALHALGISSVLVEGGSRTVKTFLQSGLIDRVYCFVSPKILGRGIDAWSIQPHRTLPRAMVLQNIQVGQSGSDALITGSFRKG